MNLRCLTDFVKIKEKIYTETKTNTFKNYM